MCIHCIICSPALALSGSVPMGRGEEMLVITPNVGPWQELQRLPGLDGDQRALGMLPSCAFPKSDFDLKDIHFNL